MTTKTKFEFEIKRATSTWQLNVDGKEGFKLTPFGVKIVQQALLSMPVWFEANQFWGYRGAEEDDPFLLLHVAPEDPLFGFTMFSHDKECLESVAAKVCQSKYWQEEDRFEDDESKIYTITGGFEPDHPLRNLCNPL